MVEGEKPGPDVEETLAPILDDAKQAGFLGRPPISSQIAHSLALAHLVPADAARVADLGSGAGLPGLVLALARPDLRITLVEASERRADHLRRAVRRLQLGPRVVVDGRSVEVVGRDPGERAAFDIVVARSFAAPATLAECAMPLLSIGGRLIVAEPPDDGGARWLPLATSGLPLHLDAVVATLDGTFATLTATAVCPQRFPRAAGVPFRRPLFA